jgi:hypothetical protein
MAFLAAPSFQEGRGFDCPVALEIALPATNRISINVKFKKNLFFCLRVILNIHQFLEKQAVAHHRAAACSIV